MTGGTNCPGSGETNRTFLGAGGSTDISRWRQSPERVPHVPSPSRGGSYSAAPRGRITFDGVIRWLTPPSLGPAGPKRPAFNSARYDSKKARPPRVCEANSRVKHAPIQRKSSHASMRNLREDYDKAMQVIVTGESHYFDSFE